MIEAEKAVDEIKRLLAENDRQIRLAQRTSKPDQFRIRSLETQKNRLTTKLTTLRQLIKDVKELESLTSFKMMTRYPENQPYRQEYKRELTRLRRQLKDMADRHQPKEKPKPRYATYATR